MDLDYWNDFYKQGSREPHSSFAEWCVPRMVPALPVVELGCGSGRDARFLAQQGFSVMALDQSEEALQKARSEVSSLGLTNLTFTVHDLEEDGGALALKDLAAGNFPLNELSEGIHIYARFFLHSITEDAQIQIFSNLHGLLGSKGFAFFEFRNLHDEHLEKTFGNHSRRYVDTEYLVSRLSDWKLRLRELTQGQGLAAYGREDPDVSRLRIGTSAP